MLREPLLLLALLAATVLGAATPGYGEGVKKVSNKEYEERFEAGLHAEAAKNYLDAVQYYLQARDLSPDSPFPLQRIKGLFVQLQNRQQPITPLKGVLPADLLAQFERDGTIRSDYDDSSALKNMNSIIWGSVIGVFLFLAIFLIIFAFRSSKREKEEEELVERMRRSPARPKAAPSSATGAVKKEAGIQFSPTTKAGQKEVKITEKTRTDMSDLMGSVKSLNATGAVNVDDGPVDMEALSESGVLAAFAQNMVSEVSSEETETGKFSKMTVEASLVFDESDAPPDLEEIEKGKK